VHCSERVIKIVWEHGEDYNARIAEGMEASWLIDIDQTMETVLRTRGWDKAPLLSLAAATVHDTICN